MKLIIFLVSIFSFSVFSEEAPNHYANYKVTFKGAFNKQRHDSKMFPEDPHFSPLVVINHNARYSLAQVGLLSTTGVKNVAEVGNSKVLIEELKKGQRYKSVKNYKVTKGIDGEGVVSTEIKVSYRYPFISAISMIAPSPDWFVALNNFSVIKENKFLNKVMIPLYAYDAGTDKGRYFTSANEANSVPVPIHPLINVSGAPIMKYFGVLIIEKI